MILAEGVRRGVAQIQGTVPDEFRAVFGVPVPGGFTAVCEMRRSYVGPPISSCALPRLMPYALFRVCS